MKASQPWYSAKTIFHHRGLEKRDGGRVYEERVVVFRARSFESAMRKGEREAIRHAKDRPGTEYLGFIEVFHLFSDVVADGAEVYSSMRTNALAPKSFVRTFYDDGSFHRGSVAPAPKPTRKQGKGKVRR